MPSGQVWVGGEDRSGVASRCRSVRAESNPGAEGITWDEDDPEMCGGGGVAPERWGGGEGADCGRMRQANNSCSDFVSPSGRVF